MKTPLLKSEKGAGLVESMAAIAILGILVMVAATLNSSVSSNNHDYTTKVSYLALTNNLRSLITYSSTCGPAMANVILAPAAPMPDREISLNVVGAQSGAAMNGNIIDSTIANNLLTLSGLKIRSLSLRDIVAVVGDPSIANPATQTEYFGLLYVSADRLSSASGGDALPEILVGGLTMVADSTQGNKIINCAGANNVDEQTACIDIGCTWDIAQPLGSRCSCGVYLKGCPLPGTYPVEATSGVFVCQPLGSALPCPADASNNPTYLRGLGLSTNYCAPIANVNIVNPTCSIPANQQWTVGANICTAANGVASFTNNSTATVNSTAGPPAGSATYLCNNGVLQIQSSTCSAALPCNAGANSLIWQDAGNTLNCTNDTAVVNVASAATAAVNDATSGANRGNATFLCTNGVLSVQGATTCAPAPAVGGCYCNLGASDPGCAGTFSTPNPMVIQIWYPNYTIPPCGTPPNGIGTDTPTSTGTGTACVCGPYMAAPYTTHPGGAICTNKTHLVSPATCF